MLEAWEAGERIEKKSSRAPAFRGVSWAWSSTRTESSVAVNLEPNVLNLGLVGPVMNRSMEGYKLDCQAARALEALKAARLDISWSYIEHYTRACDDLLLLSLETMCTFALESSWASPGLTSLENKLQAFESALSALFCLSIVSFSANSGDLEYLEVCSVRTPAIYLLE